MCVLPFRGSGGAGVGIKGWIGRDGTQPEGSLATPACPTPTGPSRPIISLSLELRACDTKHTHKHTHAMPKNLYFGSVRQLINKSFSLTHFYSRCITEAV